MPNAFRASRDFAVSAARRGSSLADPASLEASGLGFSATGGAGGATLGGACAGGAISGAGAATAAAPTGTAAETVTCVTLELSPV